MQKIIPLGHRVLVRLDKVKETSEHGIVIVSESRKGVEQKATQKATVIEVGSTAFKAFDDGTPWCKVGDRVIVSQYSGHDEIDPETKEVYRILNDEDLFAIIEG